MCFNFLYNFETFLNLRIILRDIIINLLRSSCNILVILIRF